MVDIALNMNLSLNKLIHPIGYVVKKKSNWEMTLREIGNVNL